ncbi:GNAT family N-acetyltransferase [Chryseolinea sp. H1M3-3]|uniref:GNAT family N-acetyltransferase n=1 Tax=Chryseolinea sp. H1M3-3 TaxID=3034144 RepID=UPI0023ED17C2|nr:GNAT family N-acetyltransferase [Chryseolinea sp. H1M3-3]
MIRLKRTLVTDPDFQMLVIDLDKELWTRYPDTQQNFAPHNKVDHTVRVVVAYTGNEPVGCGAFRPTEDEHILEIKRMYVSPKMRGRGIAKQILQALEQWGREEGFTHSKLETGNNQPEAIAVYKRAEYKEIPNYPPYTNMTESICMAKSLL